MYSGYFTKLNFKTLKRIIFPQKKINIYFTPKYSEEKTCLEKNLVLGRHVIILSLPDIVIRKDIFIYFTCMCTCTYIKRKNMRNVTQSMKMYMMIALYFF